MYNYGENEQKLSSDHFNMNHHQCQLPIRETNNNPRESEVVHQIFSNIWLNEQKPEREMV